MIFWFLLILPRCWVKYFLVQIQRFWLLVYSFIVFTISYLVRPLGSVFWGYIGDRYSPQTVIKYTVLMMAIPTVLIGIIPGYKQIGILSPVFLILLRLIQGIAAGGEIATTASYIYENSALRLNKTLLCALPSIGSMLGSLLASSISYLLYKLLDSSIIMEWGWRIPFLLGFPLFIIVMQIRRGFKVPQNKEYKEEFTLSGNPYIKQFVTAVVITAFLQIAFYLLFVWFPSYSELVIKVSHNVALSSNIIALIVAIISTAYFAYMAKYLSHKSLLRAGIAGISILVIPVFIFGIKSPWLVYIYQMAFGIFIGCIDAVFFYNITKLFPPHIRNRGVSIAFTCASAYFGGTAPLVCTYMITHFNFNWFPAAYIIFFGALAFLFTLGL